jgi:hypothetical protein
MRADVKTFVAAMQRGAPAARLLDGGGVLPDARQPMCPNSYRHPKSLLLVAVELGRGATVRDLDTRDQCPDTLLLASDAREQVDVNSVARAIVVVTVRILALARTFGAWLKSANVMRKGFNAMPASLDALRFAVMSFTLESV